MQVSVETTHGLERKVNLSIGRSEFESELQKRLQNLAKRAKIDGFRPGKIPLPVIKKRYGNAVEQEILGEMMQTRFFEVVKDQSLQPAGYPSLIPENLAAKDPDINFTATFEVYPEITLADMSSLEIERPTVAIDDDAIEAMLQDIRLQRKQWAEKSDAVEQGDRVTVDFEGKVDGEVFEGGSGSGMQVEVGAGRLIPGFEEKLVGLKNGDEADLDLAFPEDYQVADLAGKPVVFHIKVTKTEAPSLPEVNEEFIKSMGVEDGNLETLKDQIKQNMEREVSQTVKSRLKNAVMDQLLAKHEIELPKVLVDQDIYNMMEERKQAMGHQAMELKPEMFEQQARRRVALGLILSEVIKQNELKADPAKVRENVDSIAAGYQQPEQVVQYYYSDKKRLAEIENFTLEQSVVDWVLEKAKVQDKSVSFKELMQR